MASGSIFRSSAAVIHLTTCRNGKKRGRSTRSASTLYTVEADRATICLSDAIIRREVAVGRDYFALSKAWEEAMEGRILHFDAQRDEGVIRGDDSRRYSFVANEWMLEGRPRVGLRVDFEVDGNQATSLYPISPQAVSERLGIVASDWPATETGKRFTAAFSRGAHNVPAIWAVAAVFLSLFFPVMRIPFVASYTLLDGATGKFIFLFLLILGGLFYVGIRAAYTKVLAGITLGMLFLQYVNFFSMFRSADIGQLTSYGVIAWGVYANIAASLFLLWAAFIRRYEINPHLKKGAEQRSHVPTE